jgi:hypothetical protein
MSGPKDRRTSRPPDDDAAVPEALRQAWDELPKREPPDLVDQAVLNRARAALETPHSSRPWSFGWPHALTTTAVIVLAVILVIPLRETGQPGNVPEPLPPVQEAEESASILSEEIADDARESGQPSAARARQEPSPRSLTSPPLEKAASAPPPAAASISSGADAATEADAVVTTDRESRLRAIQALAEAGDLDAAREALVAFRQDFPDAELPPDLAALLESP